MSRSNRFDPLDGVAIVGMTGRFPGAENLNTFWQNLRDGVESISFFSDRELKAEGIAPVVLSNPNYVKARAVLEDIELFDAAFFGYSPRDAEIIDPQQRLFLECAWTALEDAGYDIERYNGQIGVYAGSWVNSYLLNHLYPHGERFGFTDGLQTLTAGEQDYLTTRVSYKLNLKGPSIRIQTACSTSLVAVHVACQALLNGECDMALAGGVSITVPQKSGYLYQEGAIVSPDGHCRAFDAKAQGTVFGSGVGVVVLKRLPDALADGDHIHAVIRGSAINNDGNLKVGYTAPSAEGQAQVIAEALDISGVDPETVTYIEAHGTGTPLGDPIEITALTQAYRDRTRKKGFCAIGSVKTNIGHLSTAAGVAGLIKTILALKHKCLPPSLHFEQPNPKIDFESSPFYVNTRLCEWKTDDAPRRAGISSFGIGGTNAHAVVEEAPKLEPSGPSRPWQLLVLSAKTLPALEAATTNLAMHLRQCPDPNLADAAYTLQRGRKAFNHRRMVVCRDLNDALSALEALDPKRVFTSLQESVDRRVAFMFPGQGSQYINMASGLYRLESGFRERVDCCSELLKPHLGFDLREALYPIDIESEAAARRLNQTHIAQPALFVVEYALAELWMEWGVKPQAMIGHSVGEYVAACLAGVFSVEDALGLVATRGRLMQGIPGGAMLSVGLPEEQIRSLLGTELSLAAVNGPARCVVAGPTDAVDRLEQQLTRQGAACQRLHTSHAFHSAMMEQVLEPFRRQVDKIKLHSPTIPYVSNLTGAWITAAEATDPSYWTRHLRQTVRFGEGVRELMKDQDIVLLEVGPGQTLTSLARGAVGQAAERAALASLGQPRRHQADVAFILETLGRLWLAGVPIDWGGFYTHERRRRIPLPTYPFERQRYWVDPQKQSQTGNGRPALLGKRPDIADWFYVPSWKRTPAPMFLGESGVAEETPRWLVFGDVCGVGYKIAQRLAESGQLAITVSAGDRFDKQSDLAYTIRPERRDDYDALFDELHTLGRVPNRIIHLWSVAPDKQTRLGLDVFEKAQDTGLYSLLFLTQAMGRLKAMNSARIEVFSNNMQYVTGDEALCPEKATILGLVKVIPLEYPGAVCRSIDIFIPRSGTSQETRLLDQLMAELLEGPSDSAVAYRGTSRWTQTFEPLRLDPPTQATTRLKQGGVYLITGGLGGIGLLVAEYLARTARAKLVLTGRSGLPARHEWESYLRASEDRDESDRVFPEKPKTEDGAPFDLREEAASIRQIERQIRNDSRVKGLGHYPGLEEALNRLCALYIYKYIKAGKIDVAKGRTYDLNDLKQRLRILPKFEKFYDFMTNVLREDDFLKVDGRRVQFLKDEREFQDPKELCEKLERTQPEFKGLLRLLDHCAENFRQALTGEVAAIGVLYPDGSSRLLEESNKDTVEYGTLGHDCQLLQAVIHQFISKSSNRRLRILEVGGGNGILTELITPDLKHRDVEYHFTDVGKMFVARAKQEAERRGFDFMRFGVLDISKNPETQGYEALSFDIILGLNVVHATPSVEETIRNLKKLLAPGGLLLLVESVKSYRWINMIWGLAEGWWYFSDADLRTRTPLLSLEKWEQVLQKLAFEATQVFPQDSDGRSVADSGLIIAQQTPLDSRNQKGIDTAKKNSLLISQIRKVLELEKSGAEVLVVRADAADLDPMRSVIAKTYERFGALDGVIHAVRVPGGGFIQSMTPETTRNEFAAKIRGTLVLDTILKEVNLDFLVLCSSQNSITGSLGQAGYCAANAFLDAYAHYHASNGAQGTVSINLDRWRSVGMAEARMTAEEGVRSFSYLLANNLPPQVVASAQDFQALVRQATEIERSVALKQVERAPLQSSMHQRPVLSAEFVAPQSEVEKQFADIWQEILGIERVGVCDNFFELGGDSLLAVQMMHRVEQTCGERLPLAALMAGPTIKDMAQALIKQRVEGERSLLVEVQPRGSKPPFFFLHGDAKRGGFYCLNLARRLGEEQPFYALSPHGLSGSAVPQTIEAMAASYIELVRAVRPEGPYSLGGTCNGGVVAFEMARQLERQGSRVDLVVLVAAAARTALPRRLLHGLLARAGDRLSLGAEQRLALFLKLRSWGHAVRGVYRYCLHRSNIGMRAPRSRPTPATAELREDPVEFDPIVPDPEQYEQEFSKTYLRAHRGYVPKPYSGRVVLLWPEKERWKRNRDPSFGWGRVASRLEIQRIPGGHITCITEHLESLAARIKSCLEAAHGNG